MKTYLNSHTTASPQSFRPGSAFLLGQLWWWWVGALSPGLRGGGGQPRPHWSQHRRTPRCFALRDANTARLQCFRFGRSAWQEAPTGSLPRKETFRESRGPQWNTCFTKGLQASASSLVSLREILAQCSSKWKQKYPKKKKEKKKENR